MEKLALYLHMFVEDGGGDNVWDPGQSQTLIIFLFLLQLRLIFIRKLIEKVIFSKYFNIIF